MKKVFNYATLISLTVLFLFLSLLFLRMHCKLIYKGETKLAEIISEGYDLGDKVINNNQGDYSANGNYNVFYHQSKYYIDQYIENNPDAREDYLYAMVLVRNDLDSIYQCVDMYTHSDLQPKLALAHLKYLNNEHKSSLVFSIIFATLFVSSATLFVVYIIKNKPKFEDIINHETSN